MMGTPFKDIREGDTLIAGDGHSCLTPGAEVVVAAHADGDLFVVCSVGLHWINDQDDEGNIIGFIKKGTE